MSKRTSIRSTHIRSENVKTVNVASGSIRAKNLHEESISDQPELGSADSSNDFLLILDATDSTIKKIKPENLGLGGGGGGGDITAVVAGTGLSGGSNSGQATVNLDINSLTTDSNAGNLADSIAISDASDSNNPKKITLTQLKTLVGTSGAGISFDGNTANGVLTFKDSDEATVEPNLTFDGSTLAVTGDIEIAQYIKHVGDSDTFIQFADDSIGITAGGEQLITVSEAGQDMVTIGDGGDVDFRVRTLNDDNTLYIEGSTDRIGVGTNSPSSILHIKEAGPTVTLQRENNSNASTIDFLGALGNTANSIVHDTSTNDLVFKTFNGSSVEEIMRLGDHYGTSVRQVTILSGSNMPPGTMQPRDTSDISFFVSGSVGSRGTTDRGTSVFGGDLVVSGTIYGGDGNVIRAGSTSDSDGDTKIQVEESADEDKIRFDTAGSERMIIDNSGKIGIGTSSPLESIHISSTGKSTIFLEADTDNTTETDTAYIKLSQDNSAVISHVGFSPDNGKNPENANYTNALSNALLVTNDWDSADAAVQLGTKSSVIATFRNGKVGIGNNNPSNALDVNGTVTANSVDVKGTLTFDESGFGAAFAFGGVAKYGIRELNDVLWRADLRAADNLAATGDMGTKIYYPLNLHGETTSNVSSSTSIRSLTDSSASSAGIALGSAGASSDEFVATTDWMEMPTVISGGSLVAKPTRTDLPSQLFDGFWSNRIDLKHSRTHTFVINFRTFKDFPAGGLSYGQGSVYIGFFTSHVNFDSVKVETFHLQSTTYNTTGRWVQRGATITSVSDSTNISRIDGQAVFKIDLPVANYSSRPVINQRTGAVLDASAARQLDYYVSALRVTIEAGDLPLAEGQTEVEYYQANGNSVPAAQRCSLTDIALFFDRRQTGIPTSFFNKFDEMTALPGGIFYGSGTASAPTISFSKKENSGLYFNESSNSLNIVGGGNESVTVDSSGNVTKIGQTAPSDGQALTWDNSNGYWKPTTISGGGGSGISDLVEDTTPQLGGNLDINGNDIVSVSNGNIDILPNGTGKINLDGDGSTSGITVSDGVIEMRSGTGSPAKIDMYCEVNNAHKITLTVPPHSDFSGNVNFRLPNSNGTNGQALVTDGSGNTSWSTISGGSGISVSSQNTGDMIYYDGSAWAATAGPVLYYTVSANGSSAYRFSGPGINSSTDNPDFYLYRGFTYIFKNNATSHPFAIRTNSGGSNVTDGVTGSQTGTQIFVVPHHISDTSLVYQCTIHGGMVGNINIV